LLYEHLAKSCDHVSVVEDDARVNI